MGSSVCTVVHWCMLNINPGGLLSTLLCERLSMHEWAVEWSRSNKKEMR